MSPRPYGRFGLLLLLMLGGLVAPVANACHICVPLPEHTLADRLLDADAVVLALSVYGQATPALRDPVVVAYRRVLDARPGMAPKLVHDLIAWRRWDFARQVEQARDALDADPLAAYSLGLYLRFAQAKQGSRAPQWRTGTEPPAASDRTELGETP